MTKEQKAFIETRTAALIAKGWRPEMAAKRARKEARPLSPAHKAATARRLAMADARFNTTGQTNSYNRI
jgi:hypothetical protein